MEAHTIATHRVASHLRAIAALQADLPRDAVAALALLFRSPSSYIEGVAQAIEATAPLEPLSDAQRDIAMEGLLEQASDMSTGEMAELTTGDWTEADWREAYELASYMTP